MLCGELRNQRGEKTEFVIVERPKKIIICNNLKVKEKKKKKKRILCVPQKEKRRKIRQYYINLPNQRIIKYQLISDEFHSERLNIRSIT